MYRVEKVLNHNAVITIHADNHKEYLIMGKGVGFGKKINERIETRPEDTVYSLQISVSCFTLNIRLLSVLKIF